MTQSGGGGQSGPGWTGPTRETADELKNRMEAFGREAQAAGERLGREAQAAGDRMARDPGWVALGTWIERLLGLAFIGVGLWFLAGVTLGVDLPDVDWRLAWPAALVGLGVIVILGAVTRRR
jgi:hypothetical protein